MSRKGGVHYELGSEDEIFDLILRAKNKLQTLGKTAGVVLCNPGWRRLLEAKADVVFTTELESDPPTIWGIELVQVNSFPHGLFVCADQEDPDPESIVKIVVR